CASVTTPTSRRRDVRASTATAPAADEERGAQLSPAPSEGRERTGCRLLLLRYTSGRQPPFELPLFGTRCLLLARISATRRILSRDPRHHLSLAVSPFPSLDVRNLPPLPFTPSPPLPYHRVSNHQHPPPRTPYPPPSTLPRALPASSDPHGHDREPRPTESCRFSASQPSDSPPRHATRAACVSLHRKSLSKVCEREKPYRAFLVP
ncbi:hypothetical protein ALC56_03177, partial [Trachymyrmex septentrionalis]